MGAPVQAYRNARIALHEGRETPETKQIIQAYEEMVRRGDPALDYVLAARMSYGLFEGREGFRWTFLSPPALYRPGKRTGNYEAIIDELPLKAVGDEGERRGTEDEFEGRLLGITAADLAVAVADEVEQQSKLWCHWTAVGDISDDSTKKAMVQIGDEL
jgi:hypothetical protein